MENSGEPQEFSLVMDKANDNKDRERLRNVNMEAESSTSTSVEKDKDEPSNISSALQASEAKGNKLSELESLYRSIEAYDWENDPVYQRALHNMLQSTALPPEELELRAKCFYWTRKTKTAVDFLSYKNWKIAQDRESLTTEPSIDSLTTGLSQSVLTDTATPSTHSEEPSNVEQTSSDEAPTPYPDNFVFVAEMILSKRAHLLPGIKEIPPIVLADKITTPTAELRKKPWESGNAEDPAARGGMFGDRRDIVIRQEE